MDIHGRTALVTGASSGIGAATCAALAAAGAHVTATGRNVERLARTASHITPGRCCVLEADLHTAGGFADVQAVASQVDLIVHSAGRGWAGAFEAMPADATDRITELNLLVPLHLSRASLPDMLKRGRGHLVFVSSIAAVGVCNEAVYAATKAGIRAFASALRYETNNSGIGITTVLPGAVRTPFFDLRGQPYNRRRPRMVEPAHVAQAIVRAVLLGKEEIFVPRWLTVPARLSGALPTQFHQLASRFG